MTQVEGSSFRSFLYKPMPCVVIKVLAHLVSFRAPCRPVVGVVGEGGLGLDFAFFAVTCPGHGVAVGVVLEFQVQPGTEGTLFLAIARRQPVPLAVLISINVAVLYQFDPVSVLVVSKVSRS